MELVPTPKTLYKSNKSKSWGLGGAGQDLSGIRGPEPRKYRYRPPRTLPEASGGPRRSKILVEGIHGSGGCQDPLWAYLWLHFVAGQPMDCCSSILETKKGIVPI